VGTYFLDDKVKRELDQIIREEPTPERRTFRMASKIINDLFYRLFLDFMQHVHRGNLLESYQSLSSMLPVFATATPYVFSFRNLYHNKSLLREVSTSLHGVAHPSLQNQKRAWFTDTLEDVNGVARTIRTMTKAGLRKNLDLTVVTSRPELQIHDIPVKNFPPVGEFELPEYELQKLSFPPMLEMLDYIQRERFTELIISTPGPVGLTALGAAKLLDLKTSGIYHTDFPQYIRILTEDDVMETMMWKFMHWFYSQLDMVFVNSNFYRDCWVERGIAPERISTLPRGLDTDLFNFRYRDSEFWPQRGLNGPVLLYVGRVSKEKDLGFLVEVVRENRKQSKPYQLAVVGDGPFLKEMKQLLPEAHYTGVLNGEELARAYASADLFTFPSTTDTFGNVVLEAMACGVPVLVSDVGGPKELVESEKWGEILPANDLGQWVQAIDKWLGNLPDEAARSRHSTVMSEKWSWDNAVTNFWNITS
jgi:glycosyltransferase involved in cell wall biosynthesis